MAERVKKTWVAHPFLFAVYPPLFLFSQNVSKIPASYILLPTAILASAVLLLWILFACILRSKTRAGLLVSSFLAWLFCYRCLFEFAKGYVLWGIVIGRHKFLFSFWTICFLLVGIIIARSAREFRNLTRILNLVSSVLVVLCLVHVGAYKLGAEPETAFASHEVGDEAHGVEHRELMTGRTDSPDGYPDIYYIILDSYASYHSLKKYYDYDNKEFYEYLVAKGFFIADQSRSNYDCTRFSLLSSLNMDYVHRLPGFGGKVGDTVTYGRAMKDNRVKRFLRQHGYKCITVGFSDEYADTSRYYKKGDEFERYMFAEYLLQMTFLQYPQFIMGTLVFDEGQRNSTLFDFDELARLSRVAGPKFVFAHIIAPHPPFVFGPDGEKTTWRSLESGIRQLYVRQLMYVNKRTKELIDTILSQSATPPVIVLQADHGYTTGCAGSSFLFSPQTLYRKLTIFNAYYLPDGCTDILYRSVTPVNTIRILFNHYFNAAYELLPDENYLLINGRFVNVTDRIANEEGVSEAGH